MCLNAFRYGVAMQTFSLALCLHALTDTRALPVSEIEVHKKYTHIKTVAVSDEYRILYKEVIRDLHRLSTIVNALRFCNFVNSIKNDILKNINNGSYGDDTR
jgi:hypothetical protein